MSPSPSSAAIDPQVIAAGSSPATHSGKPKSKAKPASKSKPSSSRGAKPVSSSAKPVSASKKPTSSSTSKITAPKKSAPKSTGDSKLSMEDMIKDAIQNDKENVRGGVSRPAIKKYLAFRFKIIDTPGNVTRLNKAISRGAEKGIFSLPKGASGKVKLGKLITEAKEPKASKVVKATIKPASGKKSPSSKSSLVAKKPSLGAKKPSLVAKKAAASKAALSTRKTAAKKVPTTSTKKTATAKTPLGKKTSSSTKKVKAAAKKS